MFGLFTKKYTNYMKGSQGTLAEGSLFRQKNEPSAISCVSCVSWFALLPEELSWREFPALAFDLASYPCPSASIRG